MQNDSVSKPLRVPGPMEMGRRGKGQLELLKVIFTALVMFVDLLYPERFLVISGREWRRSIKGPRALL